MRSAVQVWEDSVGDSGKAPTDEEIRAFALALTADIIETVDRSPAVTWAGNGGAKQLIYARAVGL